MNTKKPFSTRNPLKTKDPKPDEFGLAFGDLVEWLSYHKEVELPEEMQKQLRAFAQAYDARLGDRAHYVDDLRQVFA